MKKKAMLKLPLSNRWIASAFAGKSHRLIRPERLSFSPSKTVPEGTQVTVRESGFEALPEDVRNLRFADNIGGLGEKMPSLAHYIEAQ